MDDLELAVKLVNTVYALADPPDRLTDVAFYQDELVRLDAAALAAQLTPSDLQPLRVLRERLRGVFHTRTDAEAAPLVNSLVREANAVPQLLPDAHGVLTLDWGSDRYGYSALAARLPGALMTFVTEKGVGRLGICAAAPCECVFVDRTRPGNRRFCCEACNDRAAAAAYRGRRRVG
ncbi:hypothetical protein KNE206_66230 [Kitasatospora sp. NE20-6]|uniref:CGNR zinc finger domain-containing protein n=1 Tax=Kitasatospora sp. NE20-6 TaxID=2859066 RepID=UPI0034DC55A4